FSPASIATGSRLLAGGTGHVACGVNAHGGEYALLKSSTTFPFAGGSAYRNRPPPYVVLPAVSSRKMKNSCVSPGSSTAVSLCSAVAATPPIVNDAIPGLGISSTIPSTLGTLIETG